jgi:hypothetical protein
MLKFVFLQNAQQSDLGLGRRLSDFVKQDCVTFGQLKAPQTPLSCPGASPTETHPERARLNNRSRPEHSHQREEGEEPPETGWLGSPKCLRDPVASDWAL